MSRQEDEENENREVTKRERETSKRKRPSTKEAHEKAESLAGVARHRKA